MENYSFIQVFNKRIMASPLGKVINPYWYRKDVGGMWEEMGKLQFDYLVKEGLKPEHRLLDVGCGSLRGGVHFIKYLEKGRYFGIDINKSLLDAGRGELKRIGLEGRKPVLIQTDSFSLEPLGVKFDYVLAQSVFTHLPINNIIRCIMNIDKVLSSGGRFYATFFENPKGKHNLLPEEHEQSDGTNLVTFFDKDPFHYDFDLFNWICEGTGMEVEYIGNWNHPRDQKMMVFMKK